MSYNPAATAEEAIKSQRPSITLNKEFIKSVPGILKIVEIVVDIVIWICVGAGHFGSNGNGGFINFVATISFIFTLMLFIFYLLQVIYRLPGPWILIESMSIALSIFFFAIAIIVSAVSYHYGGPAIASAVFCAVNAIVYSVEMFLRFRISKGVGWTITARAVDGDVAIKYTTTVNDDSGTGGPGGQVHEPGMNTGVGGTGTGHVTTDNYGVP